MIVLEPFTEKDFPILIGWSANEALLMQYAGPSFSFPLTTEQLAYTISDTKRLAYNIVLIETNQCIGHAEIYFPNTTRAHLCRILIAGENYRGKGLGLLTVNQLLSIAFAIDGIEDASLNVYDWNTAAVSCYSNAGFLVRDRKPDPVVINNEKWTTLGMYLTKEKWRELQRARSLSNQEKTK